MSEPSTRTGVLLIQLGTPAAATVREVRRYLREFLSDPRVIDIPAPLRWLLLRAVILPFRSRTSAEAYRKIWSAEGSPLWVYGRNLVRGVQDVLGARARVALGMRYGEPSIARALASLVQAGAERVILVPLFPQYASASFGSAAEAALRAAGALPNVPALELLGAFYDEPGYIGAVVAVSREPVAKAQADHVLMSFHGLPERQVRKADPTGSHCLAREDCCDAIGEANRFCYRAQCYATARAIAAGLELEPGTWSVSFQSRLGREPWLSPYTDRVLPELHTRGVRRIAVLCPAFVADCLETLEEIGMRARDQWRELGGEALALIPSLNDHPAWIRALADRLGPHLPDAARA